MCVLYFRYIGMLMVSRMDSLYSRHRGCGVSLAVLPPFSPDHSHQISTMSCYTTQANLLTASHLTVR